MKRFLLTIVLAAMAASSIYADNDRAISFDRLPEAAKEFITASFPDSRIAYVKKEVDFPEVKYEVMLVDGVTVEFDRRGNWTDIECRYGNLEPSLVPENIRTSSLSLRPDDKFRRISKGEKGYELKLRSGVEMKFDRWLNLVEIDD
ncbi:MAG: PepSY-like domain-containing protein [Bacteroidetes bacterium]|uniref:PepSY-like domain-containing protein n=1 Tax=Candidatus Cryptobacteroides intestinigallinarum TaxID=2840767 RepID=A0A9D9HL92_9BACT|nr:PepSY-like domain-containing protein [Candidatus Cryptobacteroides intestinigallinarum]